MGLVMILLIYSISSLRACDPADYPKRNILLSPTYLWADEMVPNTYDGGWGYARSADVCNYDGDCYPWISGNGKYLLFGSINLNGPARPGHQGTENWDIYISEWNPVQECWGKERNIGTPINTTMQERRPCCTPNCDTLYFNRYDRDEDIYISMLSDTGWTTPVALPSPVNTISSERHPAISPDGTRLYFTSDRPGGHGGNDIWIAHWNGSSWSSVENMGPPINTPNEETRPFESFDGQRFYFSNNHGAPRPGISYGGASDIFVSVKTDSGWGPVQLVVPPINCDLTACSPFESPDGTEIWFGSEAWEGGRGDEDIWVAKRGAPFAPLLTTGYGNWQKTGELINAIYVYDLKENVDGTIYAAAACAEEEPCGKVFKTTDHGKTWTSCADLPGTMTVYSLLVNGDTLYAGTYPNGDVFKSIDGGDSWIVTANLPEVTAARRLVRLRNGDILVGTSPYDYTMRNRIFRTGDGGKSWTQTGRLPAINPCKFLVQTMDGTIYTGGWGIDSKILIHKSIDNGVFWDSLVVIEQFEPEWTADGFFETKEGLLYVSGWIPSHGVGTRTGGYLCQSKDHGISWTVCNKIIRGDGVHSGRIYAITEDLYGTLYVGMQPAPDSVVFASKDGGTTWYSTGGLDGAFECLCLLSASDGAIYAGTTPNGDVYKYIPKPPTQIAKTEEQTAVSCLLSRNYPNPFNFTTIIPFQTARAGRVTIKIYDTLGKFVKTIFDENVDAGPHEVRFSGTDNNNRILANGVYFYRIETEKFADVRKFLFLK